MRRFWVILMAISALSLVACDGGKSSKGDRSDKKRQEKTESAMPEYKQKALDYAIAVYEAEEMGDEYQMSEISVDIAKYVATLSNKHRKIFEKTYKEQYELLANSESYLSDMVAENSESHDNKKESKQTGTQLAKQNTPEITTSVKFPSRSDFVETANGLNMKMIYVEGGTFTMGAGYAYSDERPAHQVTLDSYYIAEFEVTQSQWKKVMGTTVYQQRDKADTSWPMEGVGDNYPMYYVSYEEARRFCQELSLLTGKTYLLPTESQWEFAAKGGNKGKNSDNKYSGSYSVDAVAWHNGNSAGATHSVGSKYPNELGIYDMSGNVCEWCSDWYGDYSSNSQTNPMGPSSGQYRVLRGGKWYSSAWNCRVSLRDYTAPSSRNDGNGFRVVCLP